MHISGDCFIILYINIQAIPWLWVTLLRTVPKHRVAVYSHTHNQSIIAHYSALQQATSAPTRYNVRLRSVFGAVKCGRIYRGNIGHPRSPATAPPHRRTTQHLHPLPASTSLAHPDTQLESHPRHGSRLFPTGINLAPTASPNLVSGSRSPACVRPASDPGHRPFSFMGAASPRSIEPWHVTTRSEYVPPRQADCAHDSSARITAAPCWIPVRRCLRGEPPRNVPSPTQDETPADESPLPQT